MHAYLPALLLLHAAFCQFSPPTHAAAIAERCVPFWMTRERSASVPWKPRSVLLRPFHPSDLTRNELFFILIA